MRTRRTTVTRSEAEVQALRTSELLAIARSNSASPAALRELVRRLPSTPLQILERLVVNERASPEVRAMAALELGTGVAAQSSIAALCAGARASDGSVARRCIEALGRVGDLSALDNLRRLKRVPPEARRSLGFAQMLLSYRHGTDVPRLSAGKARAPELSSDKRLLRVSRLALTEKVATFQSLPQMGLIAEQSAAFNIKCDDDELRVVANPQLSSAPETASRRPMVLAVLFKHSPATRGWFIAEYFFSRPAKQGGALVGYRPSGVQVHVGEARTLGRGVHFELRSLDTLLFPPMKVSARLGGGLKQGIELRVEIDPTRRNARARPRVPMAAGVKRPVTRS